MSDSPSKTADKKAYHKEYYTKNKKKILEGMYRLVHCDACDKDVQFCSLNKHKRTKKHQENERKNNLKHGDKKALKKMLQTILSKLD